MRRRSSPRPGSITSSQPDAVWAESDAFTADERTKMEQMGHSFRPWPETIGNMQIIAWDYASGSVTAASDPRGAGASKVR